MYPSALTLPPLVTTPVLLPLTFKVGGIDMRNLARKKFSRESVFKKIFGLI